MSVIFISRETVSGIRKLVDCLREYTGYKCLTREDLIKEIGRYGEWATEAMTQLSGATSSYESFSRIRRPYIVLMRQALLEKIREGNVVYYGFSGHLLVPRLKQFVRVRINAPLDLRIAMTMERLKCNEKAAREYISTSDDTQVRWARFVYGRDIRDPALYDLNINLGHLTVMVVCKILQHILQNNYTQNSEELKAQIEQVLLAANVESALIIDPRTRDLGVSARLENECLRLAGPYLKNTDLAVVMEITKKVAGAHKIEYSPWCVSQHRFEEFERNFNLMRWNEGARILQY